MGNRNGKFKSVRGNGLICKFGEQENNHVTFEDGQEAIIFGCSSPRRRGYFLFSNTEGEKISLRKFVQSQR